MTKQEIKQSDIHKKYKEYQKHYKELNADVVLQGSYFINNVEHFISLISFDASARFMEIFTLWNSEIFEENKELKNLKSSWDFNYDGIPLFDFVTELNFIYKSISLSEYVDDLATELTAFKYNLSDICELHESSADDDEIDVLKENYREDYDYFYDKLFYFCTNKLNLKDE